jgi:NAD(P)-dependent dehydrogenase (short-subunit alcohol dehydrogenase family)
VKWKGYPVLSGQTKKASAMTTPHDGVAVSLVTGANKGIGLETVGRLVGAGHRVYLTARDAEPGRLAAEKVGARFVQLDVTSDDSVGHAAGIVEHEEGHLDVLVNNAGITGPLHGVHDYQGDDMAEVLLTNVAGYVRVIHAFLPLLEHSSDPRVVNVSSGLGSFALAHDASRSESSAPSPLYAAAKAAINMLTVRYAQLLPGIRINSADPGMTATDLSGGRGHSVEEGADAIIAFALGGPDTPTGAFRDRNGDVAW